MLEWITLGVAVLSLLCVVVGVWAVCSQIDVGHNVLYARIDELGAEVAALKNKIDLLKQR